MYQRGRIWHTLAPLTLVLLLARCCGQDAVGSILSTKTIDWNSKGMARFLSSFILDISGIVGIADNQPSQIEILHVRNY